MSACSSYFMCLALSVMGFISGTAMQMTICNCQELQRALCCPKTAMAKSIPIVSFHLRTSLYIN